MSGERIEVVVAARREEAADIVAFELRRADGGPLPPFEAGAHIDVEAGPGLVRQYSLCNAPGDTTRYLIGVLKDAASRGGSRTMHETIREGSTLFIGAPRNLFALQPAVHTLLVGGGIGITPLIAMAESLAREGAPFSLHYCARSAERMAFRTRLAQGSYADRVRLHLDDGPPEQRLDLARILAQAPADTRLYVCGPAGFMDHVVGVAAGRGWPQDRLHLERFAPVAGGEERAFEIELAKSGGRYLVPPGRSVVKVLDDAGVFVPVSCEQGICGTCLTGVLDGIPEHRDSCLTDEERAANTLFTPCCSRALTARLVLDL